VSYAARPGSGRGPVTDADLNCRPGWTRSAPCSPDQRLRWFDPVTIGTTRATSGLVIAASRRRLSARRAGPLGWATASHDGDAVRHRFDGGVDRADQALAQRGEQDDRRDTMTKRAWSTRNAACATADHARQSPECRARSLADQCSHHGRSARRWPDFQVMSSRLARNAVRASSQRGIRGRARVLSAQ